jgi:hypothetical protein
VINDILTEVEKLIEQDREVRLAAAKRAYIRSIEVRMEPIVQQLLVGLTGPYDKAYPEIDAHVQARAVDLSIQFSQALGTVLERELLCGKVELRPNPIQMEEGQPR